jgi:hypothetical protein
VTASATAVPSTTAVAVASMASRMLFIAASRKIRCCSMSSYQRRLTPFVGRLM